MSEVERVEFAPVRGFLLNGLDRTPGFHGWAVYAMRPRAPSTEVVVMTKADFDKREAALREIAGGALDDPYDGAAVDFRDTAREAIDWKPQPKGGADGN